MTADTRSSDNHYNFLDSVFSQRLQLLWFINHCFTNDRPIPAWAKAAFKATFNNGWNLQIKQGDEGKKITAERVMSVYERLQELRHTGGKTDSKTPFEIVGEEFGIEPKFAAQMYYVVAKNIVQHWEETLGGDGEDIEAAGILPSLRRNYEESKNSGFLFMAFNFCAQNGAMIPAWLAEAIDHVWTFEKVGNANRSWDEIFGKPLPKGTQPAAQKRRLELQEKIFDRVQELHKTGKSINKTLYAEIGDEFDGISAGYVEKLYGLEKKRRASWEDK
jgi:hypothetical protein